MTSPFFIESDIELFLDGKLVAGGNFDRSFKAPMDRYVCRIDSGDNPVDAMAELSLFQREIGLDEIRYLRENFGAAPYNSDRISGYYRFSGALSCDPLAGAAGTNDAVVIGGTDPPPYIYVDSTSSIQVLAPEKNSVIQLGDYVLPDALESFSVNLWFQEGKDNDGPANLIHIFDPGDKDNPVIDLTIEPGGWIVLTVGTNWSKIWYRPGDNFDYGDGHMLTLRMWNP